MSPCVPQGWTLTCQTPDTDLAIRVRRADQWLARLIGLLGTASPPAGGSGLLLIPGGSIHTIGMQYSIDIMHLDRELRVIGQHQSVRPGRLIRAPAGTHATLEAAAGALPAGLTGQSFRLSRVAA